MKFKFGPPREADTKHLDMISKEVVGESQKKTLQHLLEVINRLWRIKSTAKHHGTDEQKEYSLILRNVSSALDIFEQMGFLIKDHTGEKVPADGSLAWKVISYQEEKDIEFETVSETLKPSVLFNNHLEQRGEVIISTPVKDEYGASVEDPLNNEGGQE